MVNGASKCGSEGNDIVSVCPNWALDHMKEKNRFYQKAVAINNKVYASAMKEEEYNKGRTVADVSDKTWVHLLMMLSEFLFIILYFLSYLGSWN